VSIGLFLVLGVLCLYSYFLYPIVLKLIPAQRRMEKVPELLESLPSLSLIITAHNEEARIQAKLENTLEIDYPTDFLEVIVASDCSSDDTDAIVESCANQGIRLVRADSRKGNCWDNAVMESFFSRLKVELIYAENYKRIEDAKAGIFEYIELFYNQSRRHSAIGYVSQNEYENRFEDLTVSTSRG
jgi:cellulose synthase/poly-beta-1,6-N-acetylglucosamine synthase-like glycosyltransferase